MVEKLYTICAKGADPYQNLGLESLLLKLVKKNECILYLWQNDRTVVIGRNQSAYRECRIAKLEEDGGNLVRRLSGGGAVYHDLGNLNFTFLSTEENSDIKRQQDVLVKALGGLGIEVELSGRNDLLASGRKFSGNSFYSHKGKCFHNGTILIATDREKMTDYLSPSGLKLQSKGVASVKSRTVNLADLKEGLTVETIKVALRNAFSEIHGLPVSELVLTEEDETELERQTAFFKDPAWTFGRDSVLPISIERRFDWGELCLRIDVQNGICKDVQVYTDSLDTGFSRPLEESLKLCGFDAQMLCGKVRQTPQCRAYEKDICAMIMEQNP